MFETKSNEIIIDQDLILIPNEPAPLIVISEDEDEISEHKEDEKPLLKRPKFIQIPEYDPSLYNPNLPVKQEEIIDIPLGYTIKYLEDEDIHSKISLPPEKCSLKDEEMCDSAVPQNGKQRMIKNSTNLKAILEASARKIRRTKTKNKTIKETPIIKNPNFVRCGICYKGCPSRNALEIHKMVHKTGKRIYECNTCHRSYSVARFTYCYYCVECTGSVFFYDAHRSADTIEKINESNEKESPTNSYQLARNQHLYTDKFDPIPVMKRPEKCYLGKKKHACKLCEATFFTSNMLEAHQMVHSQNKTIKAEPIKLLDINIKEEDHHKLSTYTLNEC